MAAWIGFDRDLNQCILKLSVKDYLVKYLCPVGESVEKPHLSERRTHSLEVAVFTSEHVWLCRNGHVNGVGSFPDRATAIAQDGEYRGIVVDESSCIIHKSRDKVAAIPFFGEAITCCDVSAAFKLAVCGTRANKIYTCSLFKDSKTRAIDLGDLTPKMVLITKAWGFIVAHAESPSGENFLLVFDVNGHQIRKTPIKFSIASWHTFASSDAFDYLVIATTTRQIYATEVFYCNLGAPIDRTTAPIVAISFIPSKSLIVAVTTQSVHFISHSL